MAIKPTHSHSSSLSGSEGSPANQTKLCMIFKDVLAFTVCCAVLCCAVLCCAVLCCAVLCCTSLAPFNSPWILEWVYWLIQQSVNTGVGLLVRVVCTQPWCLGEWAVFSGYSPGTICKLYCHTAPCHTTPLSVLGVQCEPACLRMANDGLLEALHKLSCHLAGSWLGICVSFNAIWSIEQVVGSICLPHFTLEVGIIHMYM